LGGDRGPFANSNDLGLGLDNATRRSASAQIPKTRHGHPDINTKFKGLGT
jgi:hypothetical protein